MVAAPTQEVVPDTADPVALVFELSDENGGCLFPDRASPRRRGRGQRAGRRTATRPRRRGSLFSALTSSSSRIAGDLGDGQCAKAGSSRGERQRRQSPAAAVAAA